MAAPSCPATSTGPLIVEARMEHTLPASTDGVVGDLLVQVSDRVALHQLLAVIEPGPNLRG